MTRASLFVLALLQIAVFCSSATSQQASATQAKPSSAGDIVLTESDNGRDIEMTTSSVLIVKLSSNPSAGYAWSLAGDPAPLKLQKSSFRKPKSKSSGMVGAPGTAVFQLAASSAGMTNLTLVYRRSWEYNVPPMKTFTVRVNVR